MKYLERRIDKGGLFVKSVQLHSSVKVNIQNFMKQLEYEYWPTLVLIHKHVSVALGLQCNKCSKGNMVIIHGCF